MRRSKVDTLLPAATRAAATVIGFGGRDADSAERALPAEVPVNFVYGGIPFAVMMATPADIEDFAYGFSLTEGIVRQASEVRGIRLEPADRGLVCSIDLSAERLRDHLARKRALSGRTGCGLCGVEDLASLPGAAAPQGRAPSIAVDAIRKALEALERHQPLNDVTRAVHAAAWSSLDGVLLFVREDVGRHNALDKLIGALLRAGVDPASGFVVVTSRCSFELVEKVAAFGARTLVAISAPTSLALDRARALDITLAAIARRDSMTVFHGVERILTESVSA
ncbi:formate dehydrogenase accessory sulfurtransferase FdhD [Microvirga pudoricolor]|uniref:formate dehydrogenase accessory sulfurtransferase FdhD n=1 Tax=Microvirga pudoricolor TaxID=2778729 RepID=UPI00195111E2|nr:formate dehydrogenase accessory sulfurtransferase FdhD [Microvirga pudoricolor]MBM6595687.1 formate dehydrogenase accessory sulfurtransferase FdhD [Microvirga pudoricolor]